MSKIDGIAPIPHYEDQLLKLTILHEGQIITFTGFYRKDLSEKSDNWHYYQSVTDIDLESHGNSCTMLASKDTPSLLYFRKDSGLMIISSPVKSETEGD